MSIKKELSEVIDTAKAMGSDAWMTGLFFGPVCVFIAVIAETVFEANPWLFLFCTAFSLLSVIHREHRQRQHIGLIGYHKAVQILFYMAERMELEGLSTQSMAKNERYEIIVKKREDVQ